MMGPALKVKDYSYLNRRKKQKSETCFNLAMIGCKIHVEIGKKIAYVYSRTLKAVPLLTLMTRITGTTEQAI